MTNQVDEDYEEYKKVDDVSSCVSDVLNSLGINGTVPGSYLSPIIPDKKIRLPGLELWQNTDNG